MPGDTGWQTTQSVTLHRSSNDSKALWVTAPKQKLPDKPEHNRIQQEGRLSASLEDTVHRFY